MVTKRIYKGVINGIGDGFVVDAVQTTYSYVELSDGQIIKKLIASMGINAKLREACKSAEPVACVAVIQTRRMGIVGSADG